MMGKPLNGAGLAELWKLIKAEDAKLTKIATGSYVGTGYFGKKYARTLTFDFKPAIVIIYKDGTGLYPLGSTSYWHQDAGLWTINANSFHTQKGSSAVQRVEVAFDESTNTLTWYAYSSSSPSGGQSDGNAKCGLNSSGVTYRYIAIGQ